MGQLDEGDVRSLFQKDNTDTLTFAYIEQTESSLLSEIDLITTEERISRLKNLFSKMYEKLRKYINDDEIRVETVTLYGEKHTFFEARDSIPDADDIDTARDILDVGFTCYDVLIKKHVGVGIPTTRLRWQRKIIDKLFDIEDKPEGDDAFSRNLEKKYEDLVRKGICRGQVDPKTHYVIYDGLGFFAFCLSEMPKHDLAPSVIFAGKKRIGKGNLVTWVEILITMIRLMTPDFDVACRWLVDNRIAEINTLYNDIQIGSDPKRFEQFALKLYYTFLDIDDGLWVLDNRKGVTRMNQTITAVQQAGADHNLWCFTQIQKIRDLEGRVIRASDVLVRQWQRGHAFAFASEDNFAEGQDKYDVEKLKKDNWMTRTKDAGKYHLPRLSSFMLEMTWTPLDNCLKCGHAKHHLGTCDDRNENGCKCTKEEYVCENVFFREKMKWKKHWNDKKGVPDDEEDDEKGAERQEPETAVKDSFINHVPDGIPHRKGPF